MLKMGVVCTVLVACGGGHSGGAMYDAAMQRMMTAQPAKNDDTMIGTWRNPSGQLLAAVVKDGDAYRAIIVNGRPGTGTDEKLPPLSSGEGGLENDWREGAIAAMKLWGHNGDSSNFSIYLLNAGMWLPAGGQTSLCNKQHGGMLDMKKDSKGEPVLWISLYGGSGPGWPRTMYFGKSDMTFDAETIAKLKDPKNHCAAEAAPAEAAPPAAPPT